MIKFDIPEGKTGSGTIPYNGFLFVVLTFLILSFFVGQVSYAEIEDLILDRIPNHYTSERQDVQEDPDLHFVVRDIKEPVHP